MLEMALSDLLRLIFTSPSSLKNRPSIFFVCSLRDISRFFIILASASSNFSRCKRISAVWKSSRASHGLVIYNSQNSSTLLQRFYTVPCFFCFPLIEQILHQVDIGLRNDLGSDRSLHRILFHEFTCNFLAFQVPSPGLFRMMNLVEAVPPGCCKVSPSGLHLQIFHKDQFHA